MQIQLLHYVQKMEIFKKMDESDIFLKTENNLQNFIRKNVFNKRILSKDSP
jgi:hypothetical protein